jgi:DNA-binding NarL/FixJ family response regulator
MIRLLLVDDHASLRQAQAFVLNYHPEMTVVGEAGTLAEARTMLQNVDVALLDLELPDGTGTDLIPELRSANPGVKILILTGRPSKLEHAEALAAGADGLLSKVVPIDEILTAIRHLMANRSIHTPGELADLLQLAAQQRKRSAVIQRELDGLTRRERELLQALGEGLGDREIADRFYTSVRTVQTQMTRMLAKLGVDSRLQALILAIRYGIVVIDRDDQV